MTLAEIKTELPKLTLEEKRELAGLLAAEEAVIAATADIDESGEERWDEQLRDDLVAGRLDSMIKKAIAADERGESEEWP